MSGIQVSRVLPHPVHAGDKADILDGPGFQEGIPGIHPLLRPAGDIQDQVVIRPPVHQPVPGKDREAEVIADLQRILIPQLLQLQI